MSDNPSAARPDDSRRLWAAVDSITSATQRRVERDTDAEWVAALADDPDLTICDVAAYRAATVAYGHIPSLWEQATWALETGSEKAEGGSSPLRERSPADLDLMETMLTIRESMSWQLKGRNVTPRPGIPAQMRQLASTIVAKEPQHVDWWTYRFEQWARLLATHVRAIETGPKDKYLRNAACPTCRTRQVTVERDNEKTVVPALVIDFTNGWIRAATCQACGDAWFRGDQLGALAALLDGDTPDVTVVAETA